MSFNTGFTISVPSSVEGVLVELNHLVVSDGVQVLVVGKVAHPFTFIQTITRHSLNPIREILYRICP